MSTNFYIFASTIFIIVVCFVTCKNYKQELIKKEENRKQEYFQKVKQIEEEIESELKNEPNYRNMNVEEIIKYKFQRSYRYNNICDN